MKYDLTVDVHASSSDAFNSHNRVSIFLLNHFLTSVPSEIVDSQTNSEPSIQNPCLSSLIFNRVLYRRVFHVRKPLFLKRLDPLTIKLQLLNRPNFYCCQSCQASFTILRCLLAACSLLLLQSHKPMCW